MPFTLRNLKEDLEDVGSNFDGPPDLEFRMATHALELNESGPVSYTHLRAHETVLDIVCRLLLEKKKDKPSYSID